MGLQDYKVNIIGLSQKVHQFDFEIGDRFFEHYGQTILNSGSFKVLVELDKHETMIEAKFHISGVANLICDRSLEPFGHPMELDRLILFKYGQEEKELSDEIVLITREQVSLDLGQYIFELIGVAIPMKKLHPKFEKDNLEESEIQLIYSSGVDKDKNEDDSIDPRWEKLKKLK